MFIIHLLESQGNWRVVVHSEVFNVDIEKNNQYISPFSLSSSKRYGI